MHAMPEFAPEHYPSFSSVEQEMLQTRTAREVLQQVGERLNRLPGDNFLKGIDLPPKVRVLHVPDHLRATPQEFEAGRDITSHISEVSFAGWVPNVPEGLNPERQDPFHC